MTTSTNPFQPFYDELSIIKATVSEIAEKQTATAPSPIILSGDQLQEKFSITRQTLARWRKQKRIPFIQAGGIVRYDFNKVIEALESKKRG